MTGERRRGLWADGAALGALALAVLIVAWPLGLTNRILAGIDAFTYFTPYWSYRIAAFQEGAVPLWNPYLFSGAPFLANIQAAVLYPLHWPLSWLPAERALVWSALLHLWLAGAFAYVLARRSFRATPPAAFAAALIFALGGFSLARIENINQLNALAWLPALLWLYDECLRAPVAARRLSASVPAFVGLTAAIALQLLAGHTQTTFINMIGLGLWALAAAGRPFTRRWVARLLPLLAVLPAVALSAAQLLPTLELNELGLRTGGLDFRAAVSFSLRPRLLAQSLLPPFFSDLSQPFGSEGYAEFVAYVGVTGLLLAGFGALASWRKLDRRALGPGVLLIAGLLLALGAYNPLYYLLWRFVPGFDLFRAPARWMELFAMGAALLAALGLDALPGLKRPGRAWPAARGARIGIFVAAVALLALMAIQQLPTWPTLLAWALALAGAVGIVLGTRAKPDGSPELRAGLRPVRLGLVALLFVELVIAGRALPFTAATAPMATDLRNATAALLAATDDAASAGRDRFLSLSDIRYDPGDLAELRALQADRLPVPAVERLVRAAKQVEVLAPNLPLFFRLPAVDGYDGGLLPLHRYVLFQGLFLDADNMTPDGRLAEQLDEIPDGRLLDLAGVRYVITDKQRDLWAGDVYYDLEQSLPLAPRATAEFDLRDYPSFDADALGVVAEGAALQMSFIVTPQEGPAFEVRVDERGQAGNGQAQVVTMPAQITPATLVARNDGASPVTLRGLSLINTETGAHQSITVSPRNDFRRIHSGDVKVYERLDAPGRAWIVHGATAAANEAEALSMLADAGFDPRTSVIIERGVAGGSPRGMTGNERVTTLAHEPERVIYEARLNSEGWLVMADAWYPGWQVTVNGAPADILRGNLLYRAIPLPAGVHQVALTYRPAPWTTGRAFSLATLAALLLALLTAAIWPRFTRFSGITL